jgi:predicted LPLAT superfamily acyltransferase
MPADRFVGSAKFIPLSFLGVTAHFPMGPFSVAVSRSLQVLAVNVMKTSAEGYKIYVTPLRYDSQAAKTTQIRQLAQSYVDELERVLKLYPEQWYNYYEFWNNGSN